MKKETRFIVLTKSQKMKSFTRKNN